MFTTNERKLGQMLSDPPILTDRAGRPFTFIEAEEVFPGEPLPNGGMRFRYRAPSENGAEGAVLEFTFKNPPGNRFSFGFKVSTSVR